MAEVHIPFDYKNYCKFVERMIKKAVESDKEIAMLKKQLKEMVDG